MTQQTSNGTFSQGSASTGKIRLPRVVNRCTEVTAAGAMPRRQRPYEKIVFQVWHRIKLQDRPTTASNIWEFFTDPQYGTGESMPYHFVVEDSGKIIQCVPLEIVAPGAWKLNSQGVQIAVTGDFRKEPPTPAQHFAAVSLARVLAAGGIRSLTGHTETAAGSPNKKKVCPGKYFDLDTLRQEVSQVKACEDFLSKVGVQIDA